MNLPLTSMKLERHFYSSGLHVNEVLHKKSILFLGERCKPTNYSYNKDPIGRRNGYQPPANMQELIKKTIEGVKGKVSKDLVMQNKCLTEAVVQEGK